ncbi:MAG: hypothetical protein B7733_07295 [Myxococcales bacterium FL481]|nr:MAG: hypothetical protein B7733_07295 [Myxococcales bacterium FL481]
MCDALVRRAERSAGCRRPLSPDGALSPTASPGVRENGTRSVGPMAGPDPTPAAAGPERLSSPGGRDVARRRGGDFCGTAVGRVRFARCPTTRFRLDSVPRGWPTKPRFQFGSIIAVPSRRWHVDRHNGSANGCSGARPGSQSHVSYSALPPRKVPMISKLATVLVPLATGLVVVAQPAAASANNKWPGCHHPERLRFNKDGQFKVMQVTDTQDDHCADSRTVELIAKAIEREQPDLVVFSGDIITGGDTTADEVRTAINNVVQPVEDAGVPFMIAFGNHDEDSSELTGVYEPDQLEIYRSYSCNINAPDREGRVTGTGEMVKVVRSSRGRKPAFAVWALDSGRYAPPEVNGQSINQETVKYDNHWDWIREDQVRWYKKTSKKLEYKARKKVPGLMFFHIPLPEHEYMWDIDLGWTYPNGEPTYTGAQPGKHKVEGERHECVCTGPFNSGIFSAMVERGDIKGVFVGHDHINSYHGDFYGVLLGYGASAGFGTYGLSGDERHRLRGVRVFEINEADPSQIETRMVFAHELGVDTADANQYNNYPAELCQTPAAAGLRSAAAPSSLVAPAATRAAAPAATRAAAGREIKSGRDVGAVIRTSGDSR